MMKKVFVMLVLLGLILVGCNVKSQFEVTGSKTEQKCGNSEEKYMPYITLRILLSSSAEPQLDMLQKYDETMTESANQFLEENNKEYRLKYETIQMNGDLPTEEEMEGADIICTRTTPENADYYYFDIASELKEGKLRLLYDSVPELYWERVNVNGSIYSLLATPPSSHMLQIDNITELESLNLAVPEELVGKSIEEWEDYIAEVYEATGKKAFIQNVGYSDQECPVSAGNAWNTKFQLVLPFLGIDYEHPELGVQCIFESEYGREIQNIWSEWFEKGYIFNGETEQKWWLWSSFDTTITKTMDGQCCYPLINVTYASPQVAGVSYYTTGISKSSEQKELVCQFLNDLVQDEIMHEAILRTEGERIWFDILPQSLLVENNNYQYIYGGTLEENLRLQEERFEAAELAPATGFVFDSAPVQEEVNAILTTLSSQNLYSQLKSMEVAGTVPECAVEIHYIPQEIIDILYEQGLQNVIDEANRQLSDYLMK